MNAATRRCSTCGGDCHWSDDAWTCTSCGDEWSFDHDPKYAAPGEEQDSSWEVIKSGSKTVYHRRIILGRADAKVWLSVVEQTQGGWFWARRTDIGQTPGSPTVILDSGIASSWQRARTMADRSAR